MVFSWKANQRKASIWVTLESATPMKLRVLAQDANKPLTKFADREITLNGTRTIYLSFPISSDVVNITIFNVKNGNTQNDPSFKLVNLEEKPLKTYPVWLDKETRAFLVLAENFSENASYYKATKPDGKPTIYQTTDGQFTIKYSNVISQNGAPMTTPARIGHTSGNIEVSKKYFGKYTVPMRMIILLHEFSHKYKNPKTGLEISNEVGADVNALYIYLGLGFSKVDAIYVYANVFLKAQSQGNINRMRVIMDYIDKFEKGEFTKSAGLY